MELTITKDKEDLKRLEGVIRKNLQSFYEVGRALAEIRDEELYKVKNGGEYATFEAYCKGVWDFTGRHAERLMGSVKVIENTRPMGRIPSSERQARPLAKLEPEKQREAWQKAVETAPEGKVTAAHVYKIVKEMTGPARHEIPAGGSPPLQPHIPEYAMQLAKIAISQLERINDDDPTKEKALKMVLDWINKHRGGGK